MRRGTVTPRVLVIDDEEVARNIVATTLRGHGFEVHCLPSAIGAIELIHKHAIQVVVVDYSMPTMSGDKVIQLFRKQRRLKDLVIVLISGRDRDELERVALELDQVHVVPKSELRFSLGPTITAALSRGGVRSADHLQLLRFPSRAPKRPASAPPGSSDLGEPGSAPPGRRRGAAAKRPESPSRRPKKRS